MNRRPKPYRDDHPSDAPHLECLVDHHGKGVRRHCRCGAPWPCDVYPLNTEGTNAMTAQPEQFKKKPVQIEAMQWDGTAEGATPIIDWVLREGGHAVYSCQLANGECSNDEHDHKIRIRTLEGDMYADPQDWVIRGIAGEFYPCKPGIFTDSYDRIPHHNDYARIYTDEAGEWRYRVFAGNHRLIASSEDGKSTRQGVLRELTREWPQIQNISEERGK